MSAPAIAWKRVVTAGTVPLLLADVLMSARRIARHLGSCLNLFVYQCVPPVRVLKVRPPVSVSLPASLAERAATLKRVHRLFSECL